MIGVHINGRFAPPGVQDSDADICCMGAVMHGAAGYQPPQGPRERPVVWKADGTVGERCAGWAAHSGARS